MNKNGITLESMEEIQKKIRKNLKKIYGKEIFLTKNQIKAEQKSLNKLGEIKAKRSAKEFFKIVSKLKKKLTE